MLENINNIENWQWEMFENIENMRNFGPSSSMGGTLMVPKISDRPTNVGALAKPRPIPPSGLLEHYIESCPIIISHGWQTRGRLGMIELVLYKLVHFLPGFGRKRCPG